ncbi:MAG TPA: serine/threonine-protein kinase [Actinophytocola sp.]|uniref:serine/threonine-protein kinase n=1 Tax=Actinophytocola sp. TaxID=1872138 RepID=UPI002DDCEBCC|nr:serine/threonine-protein kinase [Actinophytocola sp.]HEV2778456.1 serine/threonine-protein kinase [Actinophytocola sp.]
MSQLERIGRYRVLKWLGSGGFATVWLAEDENLDARVAIKVLADNWINSLDVRDRFVEEARILRRADSDRVVRVFDIGELDDGRPYFVMAYADRGTLADRLAGGPLPIPEALRIANEVARALAVLHGIGVIHRDITPSNVLFQSGHSGEERVLLADLGLAKAAAHSSGISLSAGTPGYMAPEQAVPGGGIDLRADVYGLGALTYHLLTGTTHDRAADVPPSSLRPTVSVDVDAVVLRALERNPDRRWPDAESFAAELKAADVGSTSDYARSPVCPK